MGELGRAAGGASSSVARVAAPLVLLALAAVRPAPARADEYERIARVLARDARDGGKTRLAVLPFQELAGDGGSDGKVVAERLLDPLAAQRGVEVVERAMLDRVMGEQKLENSGIADPDTIEALGRILGADALVTGTVIELNDGRVEVNARLIDAGSARVLAAVETRVERDWNRPFFGDASWSGLTALPRVDFAVDASAAGTDCVAAERRVDALEGGILDLKARFWAARLRAGLPAAALTDNPGSEIRDPDLRARFYARLRERSREGGPALTSEETARLEETVRRISRLEDACRAEGS
ncbi:MAG: hypothetical protein KGM24_10730 [Elusimicrobia bacterium]|nr:hypothetical protein [Elusimicrobiota bacterium]